MTAKAELRRLADENLPEWFERLNEAVNADRTYSQRVACPGMCWCGGFYIHSIAGEPIVEKHRRLARHGGQVIS